MDCTKRILLFLIILTLNVNLFGQKWENIYGNPGTDESFSDVIELYDHGYLIASFYESNEGCWLIKTDVNGIMLWEKFIKWPDVNIYGGFLDQDDNGNIYIATVVAGGPSGYWPMITKLDSCGEKVWCRVFQDYNYNYGWFDDVLVLDNGDVVALGYLDSDEEIELIFLYYIDSDGNLLLRRGYASREDYPHIRSANGDGIKKYGNNYLIHGYCYYPYPSDTTNFYQRPLYIMLDSSFNEQWIIPFGVNDSIIGGAFETYRLNDAEYMGIGILRLGDNLAHSLITYFNIEGQELGFNVIPNDSVSNEISDNYLNDIERINDSLFLASTAIIIDDEIGLWADLIIDSTGTIFSKEFRPEQTSDWTKIVKTFDNKFTIGCGWEEGNGKKDIYLYKINENLEHDTVYPGNYTYDSLCPYQIQSGEIDISDCLIITEVGEVPTPKEYFASLNSIPIKAYPNPVKEGSITFEFQNTEHLTPPLIPPGGGKPSHLCVYNVFGEKVHEERIYRNQGESKVNIDKWNAGMYMAIIFSNNKVVGQRKFIVQ